MITRAGTYKDPARSSFLRILGSRFARGSLTKKQLQEMVPLSAILSFYHRLSIVDCHLASLNNTLKQGTANGRSGRRGLSPFLHLHFLSYTISLFARHGLELFSLRFYPWNVIFGNAFNRDRFTGFFINIDKKPMHSYILLGHREVYRHTRYKPL
jgi:hypothetical protein